MKLGGSQKERKKHSLPTTSADKYKGRFVTFKDNERSFVINKHSRTLQ